MCDFIREFLTAKMNMLLHQFQILIYPVKTGVRKNVFAEWMESLLLLCSNFGKEKDYVHIFLPWELASRLGIDGSS